MNNPFLRGQRGAVAPFAILVIAALLLTAAYVQDTVRMDANSRQLKRATDAAALALAKEWLLQDPAFNEQREIIAEEYIRANLGLDQGLALTLDQVEVEQLDRNGYPNFEVSAHFTANAELSGFGSHDIRVASTAEVISTTQEVALVLDSSMTLVSSFGLTSDATLHADAIEYFLQQLYGTDTSGEVVEERDNLYVSVVPFSNGVNLYNDDEPQNSQSRLLEWATTESLTQDEDFYWIGSRGFYERYGDLTSPVYPDRRAKRQGFYRGTTSLNRRWVWEPNPQQDPFRLLARMPGSNAETGRPARSEQRYFTLSTIGDGDFAGSQTIATDPGLPNTPVLPLTANYHTVMEQVRRIKGDWEIWPMPGILWGGSTLSPQWRGDNGWGSQETPKDYTRDSNGEVHNKSLILFMEWFDGYAWDHIDTAADYIDICQQFEERDIVFYAVVRVDQPGDLDKAEGGSSVVPNHWLEPCTGDGKRLHVITTAADLSELKNAFDDIYQDLTYSNSYVRLVQ